MFFEHEQDCNLPNDWLRLLHLEFQLKSFPLGMGTSEVSVNVLLMNQILLKIANSSLYNSLCGLLSQSSGSFHLQYLPTIVKNERTS